MGKRELLLIAAFLVVGAIVYSFTAPPAGSNERGFSFSRILDEIRREVRGNPGRAEVTSTTVYPLESGTRELVVRSAFSQVQISGEKRSDIEATLRVWSNGGDDAEAKTLAEATKVSVDRPGAAISFEPDAPNPGTQRLFLTLKVPQGLHVRVETPSSRVSVDSVASVEVPSGRTETTIKQVAGRATVTQRGGKLTLEDVASLKLTARSCETTVRGIHGDASVTVNAGEMRVEDVRGTLEIEAQSSEVRIDRSEKSQGALRVNATGGRLAVNGLRSEARIDTRGTEIAVAMSAPAPVTIYSFGDEPVDLTLPPGGFVLDAVASDGRIAAEDARAFGLEYTAKDDATEQRASGAVRGGGPTITVRATGGDIRFPKR